MAVVGNLIALMSMPGTLTIGGIAMNGFFGRLLMTVAVSALQAALAPRPQVPGIKTSTTASGGTNPCSFVIGRYATGGSMAAPAMSHSRPGGNENSYLTYVIELGDVPGQTLENLYIDGNQVELGETPHEEYGLPVLGTFEGYAWIRYYDGSQTAADPMLLDKYAGHPDRPWSADMIGLGLCYAILTFKYNREVFNNLPRVRFEMGGIPLYDPRLDSTVGGSGPQRWADTSTWAPSTNLAVQIYNIKRGIELPDIGVWGGKVPAADLPLDVWFAAMNEADLAIALDGGGTEPQWRGAYEVSVDEEPQKVIQELLKGCGGRVADVGGVWSIRIGAAPLPVYFFTDDEVIVSQSQDLAPFPTLDRTYNAVHATYPDPASGWESTDAPPRYDETLEAQDLGKRLVADLSLPAIPYAGQVQRVMRAYLEDQRRFRRHVQTLPPAAALLEPLDVVAWTSERNGYDAKLFEIAEQVNGIRNCLQRVSLREVDPTDYSWEPGFTLPSSPAPGGWTLPAPQAVDGFTVTAVALTDAVAAARRPAIALGWDAQLGDTASGIRWEIMLTETAQVVLRGSTQDVAGGGYVVGEGILPATGYSVRAQLVQAAPAEWTAWQAVTTPDVRFGEGDLDDVLNDRIATALARHDDTLETATGVVADLRDAVISAFGSLDVAVPLADAVQLAYGPLDVEISISDRLDLSIARLDFEVSQVRSADAALEDIWQRLMDLQGIVFATDQRLVDAGIYVDPDAGAVRIAALEATASRVSSVEISLDALTGTISTLATVAYVNETVTNALLDPTQLPVLSDLTLRVTTVEQTLDAESGRIDTLTDTLTVNGALMSMTSVSLRLDSIEGTLALTVTQSDFDDLATRMSGAEIILNALDVPSIVQTVSDQRAVFNSLGDITEMSLADLWQAYQDREAIRVAGASARREMRAFVDEQFAAESADRLELAALVDANSALLLEEARVRVEDDLALAEQLSQFDLRVDDAENGLAGLVEAVDLVSGRVDLTETGLSAQAGITQFLGVAVAEIGELGIDAAEQGIAALWDQVRSEDRLRTGLAVSLAEARVHVDEGIAAEAQARAILGAALDEATASIAEERVARVEVDAALTEITVQLSAELEDAQGQLTELNRVEATSASVLVQAFLGLEAEVSDPATGLAAAHGEIEQLNTVDVSSDSALVQAHLGLAADVNDPATGLAAAHGEITQLNTVNVTSDSALVQAYLGLAADVNDPATGLAAAHGEIDQLNTVDVTSDSALVQAHLGLAAKVLVQDSDISAALGSIDQLNTVDVTSGSALVQSFLGLQATINDPETGLAAVDGKVQSISTVLTTPETGIVARVGSLEATLNGLDGGLVEGAAFDGLVVQVGAQGDELAALAAHRLHLTARLSEGNLVSDPDLQSAAAWTLGTGWSLAQTVVDGEVISGHFLYAGLPSGSADITGAAAFAVTAGEVYTLRAIAQALDASPVAATLILRFADDQGTPIYVWDQLVPVDLGTVSGRIEQAIIAPTGAVAAHLVIRATGAGTARLESPSITLDRARGEIEELRATRVTADGAVAAVTQTISAQYEDLQALAEATAFAVAGVDGIASGYIWRLNGVGVLELVSTVDVDGPTVTGRIGTDYLQITGLTQLDTAVITELAAAEAFLGNLTVDTLNIAGQAVTVPVRMFRRDLVDVTSAETWTVVGGLWIDRRGVATEISFSCSLDGYGSGSVFFALFRDNVRIREFDHATGLDGRQTQVSHNTVDFDEGTGGTWYEMRARKSDPAKTAGWDADCRIWRRYMSATQFRR